MATRKPKWQGRQIEVDDKVGTIIYAGGQQLLIQFPDKSRVWITRPINREGDDFKMID